MKRTPPHPINPYIRNGFPADFYLHLVRKNRCRLLRRVLEHLLWTTIGGSLPERLHLPHPFGIITGPTCEMGEAVTLMHFCSLRPKDPWYQGERWENIHPTRQEGVYVSMDAKVLVPVAVGG